jgi:hypothetical protein
MLNGVSPAIDRRLEDHIVAWARRRWPASRLVPAGWLRPAAYHETCPVPRVKISSSGTLGSKTLPQSGMVQVVGQW